MNAKEKEISALYLPFIKGSIKPVDDLTFDPDFDSDVQVRITNNSERGLKVFYSTPFGDYDAVIEAKSTFTKRFTIKKHSKNTLILNINKITLN